MEEQVLEGGGEEAGRGIVEMEGAVVGSGVAPEMLRGVLAGREEEAAPQPPGAVTVDMAVDVERV
jgi:hypothetical protein